MRNLFVLVCTVLLLPALPATAQTESPVSNAAQALNTVPETIAYQGYLTSGGVPVEVPTDFTFRLYTVAAGGSAVWTEAQGGVPVTGGIYNVALGSATSLSGVDFNVPLWLGVQVDTDPELVPRTALMAVPYALGLKLPFTGSAQVDGFGNGVFTIENTGTGNGIQVTNAGNDGVVVANAGDDGVYVASAGDDGVHVLIAGVPSTSFNSSLKNGFEVWGAQGNGLYVGRADADGVYVENAGGDGFEVLSAGGDGLQVINADNRGVYVQSAGDDGVFVKSAGTSTTVSSSLKNGFEVTGAEGNGLFVGRANADGVYVEDAGDDGVSVQNANADGVYVENAGDDGVQVLNAGGDGVSVNAAGDDGVYVQSADDDGVYVASAGGYSLNIKGQKNSSASLSNHIALIANNSFLTSNGPDVLALKTSATSPTSSTNFITFFDGANAALGRIEGNGTGGIVLNTPGADYAEYLPHLTPGEVFSAGDVVGVFGGKISRQTRGAEQVMVLTDRPAVLGNAPPGESTEGFEAVSFVGQVPVRVTGRVASGDYLLASGLADGRAVAVSPREIVLTDLDRLVGRAWGAGDGGRVVAVVGLDRSEVLLHIIARQQAQIDALLQWQASMTGSR